MSELEKNLERLLHEDGLMLEGLREYRFHPVRKWRWDFAWPESRVAAEVQGGIWVKGRHVRPSGLLKDYEKWSAGASLGWRLVLVTGLEISNGEAVARIKRALRWRPHCPRCAGRKEPDDALESA